MRNRRSDRDAAVGQLRDLLTLLDQPLPPSTLDDGLHRLCASVATMTRDVKPTS